MAKTITVKGVGKATVKPDQVEIRMTLSTKDKVYEKSMSMAAEQIDRLKTAFESAGFGEGSLKTTNFDIRTVYDSVRDRDRNYVSVFSGYECTHNLKLVFDFDTKRLSAALGAIASSKVNPKINIDFTVKNPAAVNELILQDAAANAKRKAEILCAASGVKLGELVCIDYNWGDITYISQAKYAMEDCIMSAAASPCDIDIDPDDIDAGDTATFVWEII